MHKYFFIFLFFGYIYANSIYWDKIAIQGPLSFSLEEWGLKDYNFKSYDSVQVNIISKIIQNKLFSTGYIFAQVKIYLKYEINHIILVIEIAPNDGYKFGLSTFDTPKTNQELLQRFVRLEIGSPFSFEKIDKGILRLQQLEYFDEIKLVNIFRDSLRNVLYPRFKLSENKQNKVSVSLNFLSKEIKDFSGLFDIYLKNMKGTARDLNVFLFSQGDRKEFRFFYKEPFFPGTSLGTSLEGEIIVEDSSYQFEKILVSFFQYFYFNYRYNFIIEANRSKSNLSDGMGEIKNTSLISGIAFSAHWVDDFLNKKNGLEFKLQIKTGKNQNDKKSNFLFYQEIEVSYWKSFLQKRLVYYQNTTIKGRFPLQSQRHFYHNLGGAKTIRGYRKNQIFSLWSMYSNLEWRLYFKNRDRIFVFYDPAWVYNRYSNGFIYGYGLGFFLQSNDVGLEISFALGKERSISNGLINFIVENHF